MTQRKAQLVKAGQVYLAIGFRYVDVSDGLTSYASNTRTESVRHSYRHPPEFLSHAWRKETVELAYVFLPRLF